MEFSESFEQILQNTHYFNWHPDLYECRRIYAAFPNSYAILSPFFYSYLEELVRSNTREYGAKPLDLNGKPINKRAVGYALIIQAIEENKTSNPALVEILNEIKVYYRLSEHTDQGENRHSVAHGFIHPRFWTKMSFEKLIYDIARLSKFARW